MSDNSNNIDEKPLSDDVSDLESVLNVEQNMTTGDKTQSKKKKKSKKGKSESEPKRDSKARTASAAVFFNDNKAIAGFGNSMRAVFTSVRELVENSLDASEKRGNTPNIHLRMRRLSKKEVDKLMGTSIVKTKEQKIEFIELSCRDNGVGVDRELIPQLFGTVLAGTKYGAQQTRGRFGLGSKMVLLHAMSTLDLPIQITTRSLGSDTTHRVQLFINLEKNEPIIHKQWEFIEGDDEYFDDYGTEIKVSFTGSWTMAKNYVKEYFKQLAIITPYADIFATVPGEKDDDEELSYLRVVDELPDPPQVVKVHPWGTDISTFRREMMNADETNLIDFLVNNFMGVDHQAAESFFEVVGVDPNKPPVELTSQEIRRIVHDGFSVALKEAKTVKRKRDRVFMFNEPSGDSLSPLGADRLRKGLEKELAPDFVESVTRAPHAYEGHPFIIEAAIGYGGGVNEAAKSKSGTVVDNRVIYRFANRIPLIFGAGNDLITKVANSMNWSKYGLTRGTEPLAIAVSLVSTKIPFPETSKEYIDTVDEIQEEVKLVLEQLGRKLRTYLGRRRRRTRERQRKSLFDRHASETVENLLEILEAEGLYNRLTGVSSTRIISALSSGSPRINPTILPFGEKLSQAPIWSEIDVINALQTKNIYELSTFLRTSNNELAKILKWKSRDVDLVKRRTIQELELKGDIIEIDPDKLVDPEVEKRFNKKSEDKIVELPRLNKSLSKRWIRNVYDYIVSPSEKLKLVSGMFTKFMEMEKYNIISAMNFEEDDDLLEGLTNFLEMETGQVSQESLGLDDFFDADSLIAGMFEDSDDQEPVIDAMQSSTNELNILDVIPNFDNILGFKEIKNRKITNIYEFFFDIAHPTVPIDEKVLALDLVSTFKEKLMELIAINPEIGMIVVDEKEGQKWLDGNISNAFKRKKIHTLMDILAVEDKELAEIGWFIRLLYNSLLSKLLPTEENLDSLQLENNTSKIKILKKAGFKNIESLLVTSSLDLVENPDLKEYFDLLVEESKDKIIEMLTLQNSLGELSLIKIIPPDLENEMYEKNIYSSTDLLRTPIPLLTEKYHEKIRYAKKQIGASFNCLNKTQTSLMEKLGITVLDELIFNPNYYVNQELSATDMKNLERLLDQLMKPVYFIDTHLIASVDLLFDAGITTVGKFLVWPNSIIAEILNYQEEWISLLKENFSLSEITANEKKASVPLETLKHLISEELIDTAIENGFTSVHEISQIKWGDIFPVTNQWAKISLYNKILTEQNSIDYLEKINIKGVSSLTKKLKKKDLTNLMLFLDSDRMSLDKIASSKKDRDILEKVFASFSSGEGLDQDIYAAVTIFKLTKILRSPIVNVSGFTIYDIEKLNELDIRTLHQVIFCQNKDIQEILHLSDLNIPEKLAESELVVVGTPLYYAEKGINKSVVKFTHEGKDDEYFSTNDINGLLSVGYSTIEQLAYMADHRTFSVPGISWEVISHFKKLLQSPLVLITWVKEMPDIDEQGNVIPKLDKDGKPIQLKDSKNNELFNKDGSPIYDPQMKKVYFNFDSTELEILYDHGVKRIIDFLTATPEKIKSVLDWPEELIEERLINVELKEAGIELADLEIFRADHISHLKKIGLVTIEDLYFTANKETWDSDQIPWASIETIKNILHLDIINAVEEIGPQMVEVLKTNGIETILDLYLTAETILSQKTGLPEERFENLKFNIDLGALIEAFDKSVLFTPGLNYFQTMVLNRTGYSKVLDIILGDNDEISLILEVQREEIDFICDNINRTTIKETEDDRGVQLKEIKVFNRSDAKSVATSGIFERNEFDTLQEVIYQIRTDYFQGEKYLLTQVENLKKVCAIPLEKIGDLNRQDLTILINNGLTSISDVLLIPFEDISNDHKLYTAVQSITKSIIDLRPFMAIAQLRADVALREGSFDGTLLEAWLANDSGLHHRVINSLRSLLSIPIIYTHYVDEEDNLEEISDKTVGDIILSYAPDVYSQIAKFQSKINQPKSLIKLLKEGSTPITLLDLDPLELRALQRESITTIERLLTKDPKDIIQIAGNTQKFWKSIMEIFKPDIFNARLEDIGVPFTIFGLHADQRQAIEELDLSSFEQLLFLDELPESLEILKKFMFSSTNYLIGTPGEKELSENEGAKNILESIMAMRKKSANPLVVKEMIQIAWSAYYKNAIPIEDIQLEGESIYTLQDLAAYVSRGGKCPKTYQKLIDDLNSSVMLLPLSPSNLKTLIHELRCSTIMDAITSPMAFGEIGKYRTMVAEGEEITVLHEIKINLNPIKVLDKSTWNRLSDSDLCLQDIIASPRTYEEFKGVKLKYLQSARNALHTPLIRYNFNNRRVFFDSKELDETVYLEDLIYLLPTLLNDSPELVAKIITTLQSDELEVVRSIPISEELTTAASMTFNIEINDFQSLYSAGLVSSKIVKSIHTNSAILIRDYLLNSLKSIACLEGVTEQELWDLWKLKIYTIADLLLSPVDISNFDQFTNKRERFLKKAALDALEKDLIDPLLSIKRLLEVVTTKSHYRHDLSYANLIHKRPHPLIKDQLKIVPKRVRQLLKSSILYSDFCNELSLEDMTAVLKLGIRTFADLLFIPEKLDGVPEDIRSLEARLVVIATQFTTNRSKITLSQINLPESYLLMNGGENSGIIDLLALLYRKKLDTELGKLSIRLQYSNFATDHRKVLRNNGYQTIMDLFIASPFVLSELLEIDEEEVLEVLKSHDITELINRMSSIPLQISTLEKISKNSRAYLEGLNLQTVLDIKLNVLDNINRTDSNYIGQLIAILNSSVSLLNILPEVDSSDLEDDHQLVRDVIRFAHSYDTPLNNIFGNFTDDNLLELVEKQRRLGLLDGIINKEEKILHEHSIFTFNQLAKTSIDDLISWGLEEEKYESILDSLAQSFKDIIGITEPAIEEGISHEINTVAEFLSHRELLKYEYEHPIKIRIERTLSTFFTDDSVNILKEKKINYLNKFLKSKTASKLLKEEDPLFIKIVGTLNLPIEFLPKIKRSWVSVFLENKIYRIHQYLNSDLQELATMCDTSYTTQENYLTKLDLTDVLFSEPIKIPYLPEDETLLRISGAIIQDGLLQDGILLDLIHSDKKKRITAYQKAFTSPIWVCNYYWNLNEDDRAVLANTGDTLAQLVEAGKAKISIDFDELLSGIFNSQFNEEFIEGIDLSPWLHESIAKELKEKELIDYYSWMFASYKEGDKPPGTSILRASISILTTLTVKQVLKAFENGVTHISDLVTLPENKYYSSIGIAKSKIDEIKGELKSIRSLSQSLPVIAYFNSDLHNSLREGGVTSWSELIGNIRSDELALITGFTDKTRQNFLEKIREPIWSLIDLRNLGLKRLQTIVKKGCITIQDLLIIGDKIRDVISEQEMELFYKNLDVSSINKGLKHPDIRLSKSKKFKVSDEKALADIGIQGPIHLLLGAFTLPNSSPFEDGVNDWIAMGEIDVEALDFPEAVIKAFKDNGLMTVGEVILRSNDFLRDLGASNKQLKDFREKFTLTKPAKKPSKKVSKQKDTKVPAKKTTSKADKSKSSTSSSKEITSKKSTSKKSATKKKATAKKTTAKAPAAKKKTTAKKPEAKKKTTGGKKKSTKK
ncbi:MAG: DNA topoisomerase VI subunit B [Candidatus Heimdallarchaeota archaeon]|nr:DNA topoisomerase VI subunit B [Candidatus Heimdallarchaeota archaeon]